MAAEITNNLDIIAAALSRWFAGIFALQSRFVQRANCDAADNLSGSRTKSAKEFLAAKNAKNAKKWKTDAKRSP